jgi:hypothetical protein
MSVVKDEPRRIILTHADEVTHELEPFSGRVGGCSLLIKQTTLKGRRPQIHAGLPTSPALLEPRIPSWEAGKTVAGDGLIKSRAG